MKHDAIVEQGIPIHERVPIPDEMIPADSRVEIDAKIQAGYCKFPLFPSFDARSQRLGTSGLHSKIGVLTHTVVTTGHIMSMDELANVKGRGWEDVDVSGHPVSHHPRTQADPSTALSDGVVALDGERRVRCCHRHMFVSTGRGCWDALPTTSGKRNHKSLHKSLNTTHIVIELLIRSFTLSYSCRTSSICI